MPSFAGSAKRIRSQRKELLFAIAFLFGLCFCERVLRFHSTVAFELKSSALRYSQVRHLSTTSVSEFDWRYRHREVSKSCKHPFSRCHVERIIVPSASVSRRLYAIASPGAGIQAEDKSDLKSESLNSCEKYNWTPLCLQIAVPAFVGMLADPLLSLMDTAYVGQLGTTELAALGACTSIFHLAFNAFRATTAATTSLVATHLSISEKNGDISASSAKEVTSISLWFGWWVGLLVSCTLYFTGIHALAGMGVPSTSSLFPAAKEYLYSRLWAAPAVLFIGVAEGAFRGYGDTIVPLIASLVAAALNLVLDPLLMFTMGWGVRGAAVATAISQCGAALTYAFKLVRRKMLPPLRKRKNLTTTATGDSYSMPSQIEIIRTILGANAAMLMKQGSLLLGWAYATARATRLGADHVAAHQVGLSVWLVFALILDGAAVAAQVLMSRAYVQSDRPQVMSLTRYMLKVALLQGIVSMLVVDGIDLVVPQLFTRDPVIQGHLHQIMPHLAWQQILVSLTLVTESLAVGAIQFRTLAIGTALSTVAAIWQISKQTTVEGIWSYGIVSLFAGRLLTATIGCMNAFRLLKGKKTKVLAS
jgi:putative MATE family efflux protein